MPSRFASALLTQGALLLPDRVVVDQLEYAVEARVVVAGVDRQARGDRRRKLANEVQPPQLDRVHAELACERVDGTLDRVGGLGASGAAIRVGRHRVREHAGALEAVPLDVVGSRIEPRAEQRNAGRDELEICAHRGRQPCTDGGDLARRRGGELDLLDHVAAVDRGQVALAAGLRPLDRASQPARDYERERLFCVDVELRAEAAADYPVRSRAASPPGCR